MGVTVKNTKDGSIVDITNITADERSVLHYLTGNAQHTKAEGRIMYVKAINNCNESFDPTYAKVKVFYSDKTVFSEDGTVLVVQEGDNVWGPFTKVEWVAGNVICYEM